MTNYKLVFEPTPGRLEYLQDTFNELIPEHNHSLMENDILDIGGLYLENGMWVNYYKCSKCPQKLVAFGKFGESDD